MCRRDWTGWDGGNLRRQLFSNSVLGLPEAAAVNNFAWYDAELQGSEEDSNMQGSAAALAARPGPFEQSLVSRDYHHVLQACFVLICSLVSVLSECNVKWHQACNTSFKLHINLLKLAYNSCSMQHVDQPSTQVTTGVAQASPEAPAMESTLSRPSGDALSDVSFQRQLAGCSHASEKHS